ncbi:unnamed protein product [Pylaiella littoralis]
MPQPNSVVSVWYHLDFLFSCTTPVSQATNFYREGKYTSCSDCWKDFRTSIAAKMCSEEADALEILKGLSYRQRQGDLNPSLAIWERKEKPSFT